MAEALSHDDEAALVSDMNDATSTDGTSLEVLPRIAKETGFGNFCFGPYDQNLTLFAENRSGNFNLLRKVLGHYPR